MLINRLFIATGLVIALAGCDTTGSVGRVSSHSASDALRMNAHMPSGQQVMPPLGYISFCMRSPAECNGGTDNVADMALTPERWTEINEINDYVNKSVTQVEDNDLYQKVEYWAYPTAQGGDCEDIALEKRKLLISKGWDASSLLIAVVREWNGDGHAVLLVTTDKGEYVLDNKNHQIVHWQDAPYNWVKRQSRERPYIWVNLDEKTFRPTIQNAKLPPVGAPAPFLRYAQNQATPTPVAALSASVEASLRPTLIDAEAALSGKTATLAMR